MEFLDIQTIIRAIFLAGLYLTLTKEEDMNIKNISRFSLLYLVLFASSDILAIDQNVITTAFTTKFIFTFLDDHIIKTNKEKNQLLLHSK
jgi:hypothetical protein